MNVGSEAIKKAGQIFYIYMRDLWASWLVGFPHSDIFMVLRVQNSFFVWYVDAKSWLLIAHIQQILLYLQALKTKQSNKQNRKANICTLVSFCIKSQKWAKAPGSLF